MADKKYIEWLLEGKTAWNKRRELHNFRPRFSFVDFVVIFRQEGQLDHNGRVDLSEFDLSNTDFHGANLSQVDFQRDQSAMGPVCWVPITITLASRQADLTDAVFGVGYLGDADLSSATLTGTDLVNVNLTGADLGWSRFGQAKLYPDSKHVVKSVAHTRDTVRKIEKCCGLD